VQVDSAIMFVLFGVKSHSVPPCLVVGPSSYLLV
jgi:hypothetical protein